MEYTTYELIISGMFIIALFGALIMVAFIASLRNEKETYIKSYDLMKAKMDEKLPIADTIKVMTFFDSFLATKFSYYLNTSMIAYFVNDKDIDKKEIKKLKIDFYSDVSNSLNNDQKADILKIFTKEGIELYIHQTFLRLVNEANIRFKSSNDTGMDALNTSTLNTIYKG